MRLLAVGTFKDPLLGEIKKLIWEEVKKVNDKLVLEKHIREIDIRDKEFEKTTTMKIKRYMEEKD